MLRNATFLFVCFVFFLVCFCNPLIMRVGQEFFVEGDYTKKLYKMNGCSFICCVLRIDSQHFKETSILFWWSIGKGIYN